MIILYYKIANSNYAGVFCIIFGWMLRFATVTALIWINKSTTDVSLWLSILYLLFERPIFVIGATITILPFLLKTPVLRPITKIMSSRVWYPLARLTYGAYLCHGIFMLFRTYDTQKGVYASEFDAFLFFFAYITFAFVFSFIITLMIEIPILRLVDTFIVKSKGSLASNFTSTFRSFKSEKKDDRQDLLMNSSDDDNTTGAMLSPKSK